jgi:glycosyltransferase involved in cell wall biosynthesis
MRIVTNAIPLLSPRTGVGQYVYNILKRLEIIDNINEYTYFYGYFSDKLIDETCNLVPSTHRLKKFLRSVPGLGCCLSGIKGRVAQLNISIKKLKEFDVYFEPNFIPISEIKARKKVVTIHDLSFRLHSHWFPTEENHLFNQQFDRELPKIDSFITVSNYVKQEMIENLCLEGKQISVVYNGYNESIFRIYEPKVIQQTLDKYGISGPYILFVGTVEPRKNIVSLLKAYRELQPQIIKDFKLVIAGGSGWLNDDVYNFVNDEALRNSVIFTGYVTDLEIAHLMNGATVFVYPSFYEGFGLPPLEAMACGTPVIVSNTTSMKELYQDVAYLIDPYDYITIAEGLKTVLNDNSLQEDLAEKGVRYAEIFSWEKSAIETLNVLQSAI